MALVPCSFCGEMISDQATVCPKCGAPVNQSPAMSSNQSLTGTSEAGLVGDNVQKVNTFLQLHASELPAEKVPFLREKLMNAPSSKVDMLTATSLKNPTTYLLISIFLGGYGVDRFMLGDTGMGILKLLTCGGAGIWAIIDWFTIVDKTRNANYNTIISRL